MPEPSPDLRSNHRNPAETIELGPRVTWFLSEEEAVGEATRHYMSCTDGYDGYSGCRFCYYGPIEDIFSFLKYDHKRRPHLGSVWYF